MEQLEEANKLANKFHILVMGDFNFPEIDYSQLTVNTSDGAASNFF